MVYPVAIAKRQGVGTRPSSMFPVSSQPALSATRAHERERFSHRCHSIWKCRIKTMTKKIQAVPLFCYSGTHYPPSLMSPGNQSLYVQQQYVQTKKKTNWRGIVMRVAILLLLPAARWGVICCVKATRRMTRRRLGARRQRPNQLKTTSPSEKLTTNEHRLWVSSSK